MKACRQCGGEKPLEGFYAHPQMADGHLNVCRECVKENARIRRRTDDSIRAYDRERAKRPERRAKSKVIAQRFRDDDPLAYAAHSAVNYAIKSGKLTRQPCLFCAATTNIHAHHRDYAKPLDVVWLCAKCHHRLHATFPETAAHERKAA